ncbi:MAG TPA: diguanylate cyclase, partial [Polyangiaceae bacterium]|nr:diguanylate cyclase [Polyangiaceae bacterium]
MPRPGEELAGLARRVIVLGIIAGAPVIAGTWLKDGPHDAWVRWGYPPLGLVLLSFAWILLRRPRWTVPAALSLLVVLELGWIVIALGRISEATSATDAWASLVPSPLLGVVVCLVVGFLFQGTRTALVHGSVYSFVFTAVVTAALWRRAGTADDAWLAVRYGVYLAVFLVLLFVLSRAKEHVTTAVAQAARADARATRMRDMAYLDELTGIANRRRLLDELVYQSELVTDTHPVCVVFFDLDHFKAVNDTFGHET